VRLRLAKRSIFRRNFKTRQLGAQRELALSA
jgi:hypothetical protein